MKRLLGATEQVSHLWVRMCVCVCVHTYIVYSIDKVAIFIIVVVANKAITTLILLNEISLIEMIFNFTYSQ